MTSNATIIMFDDMDYVSDSSFRRASKLFGKLNKSFDKSYFDMLYFADRFDEVPVASLIKTNIFRMEVAIPCVINHLCFPSKQIPQDRAGKVTIKNSVYIRFSKREYLH